MNIEWRTACTSGGNCVRVGYYGVTDTFVVADTKNPDGPELEFTRQEWVEFLTAVKNGEMDWPHV